tara:strand:- start:75 stop:230 length:156 start_codon:yes stop_codon:yes gene_type:complete
MGYALKIDEEKNILTLLKYPQKKIDKIHCRRIIHVFKKITYSDNLILDEDE